MLSVGHDVMCRDERWNLFTTLVYPQGEQCGLNKGEVSEDEFALLIALSTIHSKKIIYALRDYLVSGESRKIVCERYGVNNGYLSTSLSRLYKVNCIVIQLMSLYCKRHEVQKIVSC